MAPLPATSAPICSPMCRWRRTTRLLDLGGSHGMHSIRFCQRYPQLGALIVDLPSALTETDATIARHGLAERIHASPGELLVHDWHGQHDVVFYLSVAHNHTPMKTAWPSSRFSTPSTPAACWSSTNTWPTRRTTPS
jgi:hypothetical protein